MTKDEFKADISRVEQRLAAGRLRTAHDWNELGSAVTRKTSWLPLALGALGAAALVLSLRGGGTRAGNAYRPSYSRTTSSARWSAVLAGVSALVRLATLPQVIALVRSLRNRRR